MDIDPRTDALIVVDVQHDFLPGGALAVPDGDAILPGLARLAPRFGTVVATQDWHPLAHVSFASSHPGAAAYGTIALAQGPQELWPDHCVQGTRGAELHPAVPEEPVTLKLRKGTRPDVDSYSAFRENVGPDGTRPTTGLGAWLAARGVRRVFVAGLARDFCVRATAVDAAAEGFETLVIDGLTRAVFPDRKADIDAAFARAGVRVIAQVG
ncbi:MAG: nicotinamidase [Anaeromyxobacteraceae bacterium]